MAANTKIEWAHNTFNPWVGCTKVSAACDHCYAESWAKRSGHPELWSGGRRRTTPANWRQPAIWNTNAKKRKERFRVFCASLADVFDNQVPEDWRRDLFGQIFWTPNLDWLLLTKRPQNARRMIDAATATFGRPWPWRNVWLGTTVENQEEADRRIPHLLKVPARVHFLSCEPLLGPIDLRQYLRDAVYLDYCDAVGGPAPKMPTAIDWVICGGESGTKARIMRDDWARALRDQCAATCTAFFFKQWGEWAPSTREPLQMARVGKKSAGRLLDGREYNEFPEPEKEANP